MKAKNQISSARTTLAGLMILAIVLSTFGAWNVPVVRAQEPVAETPAGVIVSLSADQASFGGADDVILHVTITNPNGYPINMLKWLTPLDGVEEPLFTVTRDGEPVVYIGKIIKRTAPTEQDYIILAAGESLTREVDLSTIYDLSTSGNYAVQYNIASTELYGGQSKTTDLLTSNTLVLSIEGRTLPVPVLEEVLPQTVTGTNSFIGCSFPQQIDLINARNAASTYSNGAVAYFSTNRQGLRYITWFGTYDAGRYSTVSSHFTNIRNAVDTANPMTFDCSTCTNPNWYAYVYRDSPYRIYLCGVFWSAPLTGTDSKAGTLIHEISHFTVVSNTNDYVYGQTGARNLAISNPANAVMNADNHEYFAENTPPINEGDNYESDDISVLAKWIYSGSPQTHSIVPAADVDWVKFQLYSPSAILLETSGPVASSDTRVWLYNNSLTQIDYNDDSGSLYSFIDRVCSVDPLPAGTYYVKVDEYNNNHEIPSYNLSFNASACPSASINTYIAGRRLGSYLLAPGASTRQNYAGVDAGPVKVISTDGTPIITALRDAWAVNGVTTSFSQLMGLPLEQLSNKYVFPGYNNVTLNDQLRIANVDTSPTTVIVTIGGVLRGAYPLAAGEAVRINYAGVDSGPVVVEGTAAGVKIIAAIREAWSVNGVTKSFVQLMGLPAGQLSNKYVFPAYNNVTLNEQLRIGNVDAALSTVVTVTIGGVVRGTYPLGPGQAVRVNYAGLDSGPVIVEGTAGVPIISSIRSAWSVNGVTTSFSQLMGMPSGQLSNKYLFPAYNNVTLNEQLRIANVDPLSGTTVTVRIGGVTRGTYILYPLGSLSGPSALRINYAGLDSGPVVVQGTTGVKIISAIRSAWSVNGVIQSFVQLMGLPSGQLSSTYLFPAYNNVTLNEQLRIGVP